MGFKLKEIRDNTEKEYYFNIPERFNTDIEADIFVFYINRYSSRQAYLSGEHPIGESMQKVANHPDLNKNGNLGQLLKKHGYEHIEKPIYEYKYKNQDGIYEHDEVGNLIIESKTNVNRFRKAIKVLEAGQE
jgi:hypothetical protein